MKPVMTPGKLNQWIIIEQPAPCDPASTVSDQPECWETVVECYANVRPVSVKEIYAAGGFLGQQDLALILRYDRRLDDLTNQWRVWHQNRKLDIVGKMNIDSRNRWLKLLASRRQDDIRIKDPDFDQPLNDTVHVILPELTDED